MNPEKLGKTLGIGVRVAGRISQQRVQSHDGKQGQPQVDRQTDRQAASPYPQSPNTQVQPKSVALPDLPRYPAAAKEFAPRAHRFTRAAGRGMGGFLRPFGRVGGILWLEVTGFFFGLFALYFAQDIWKVRAGYATGPLHMHFLISSIAAAVFAYLSVSAFWRARKR